MKGPSLLCLLVLLAPSCSRPSEKQPPSAATPATAPHAAECIGIGPVPASPVITYLSGAKLFQLDAGDANPQCLAKVTRPLTLSWSNNGDQVLLGGLQTFLPAGGRPAVEEQVRSPRWSFPTGKATVHISIDSRKLLKIPAGGGPAKDISFLARHDEVVYHPAGTHIAVAGKAEDGHLGIFLAVNDGSDPRILADAEDAKSISSLAFDTSGESLYFAAEHDGMWHLHRLHVAESRLETVAESKSPIARIMVSPDGGKVAWRQGSCSEGTVSMIHQDAGETMDYKISTSKFEEPAGWQGNNLLVLARKSSCDEPGDLLNRANSAIAHDVDRVALRQAAQRPPPAPPIPGAGVA